MKQQKTKLNRVKYNSSVTIYRLPWSVDNVEKREEWLRFRSEGMSFNTELKDEEAAEEAFCITNAPLETLNDNQRLILAEQSFNGPCLSVGDIVNVRSLVRIKPTSPLDSKYYLCKSFGWEKYEGNVITLLKYLS